MTPRSFIIVCVLPILAACSFASNTSPSYAPQKVNVELAGTRTALEYVYASDRTNNFIDVFDYGGSLR